MLAAEGLEPERQLLADVEQPLLGDVEQPLCCSSSTVMTKDFEDEEEGEDCEDCAHQHDFDDHKYIYKTGGSTFLRGHGRGGSAAAEDKSCVSHFCGPITVLFCCAAIVLIVLGALCLAGVPNEAGPEPLCGDPAILVWNHHLIPAAVLMIVWGSLLFLCPTFCSCLYYQCGCTRELYYYTTGVCFNSNQGGSDALSAVPEYFFIFVNVFYAFTVLCVRLGEGGDEVFMATSFYQERQLFGLVFCFLFLVEMTCRIQSFGCSPGMSCNCCREGVDWIDSLVILAFITCFILGMPQLGILPDQYIEIPMLRILLRCTKIGVINWRGMQRLPDYETRTVKGGLESLEEEDPFKPKISKIRINRKLYYRAAACNREDGEMMVEDYRAGDGVSEMQAMNEAVLTCKEWAKKGLCEPYRKSMFSSMGGAGKKGKKKGKAPAAGKPGDVAAIDDDEEEEAAAAAVEEERNKQREAGEKKKGRMRPVPIEHGKAFKKQLKRDAKAEEIELDVPEEFDLPPPLPPGEEEDEDVKGSKKKKKGKKGKESTDI